MWRNWNAERGVSEEGNKRTYYTDGTNDRSLQGSYPGSCVEFDAEPGLLSDRSSEVAFGTGSTRTSIDWESQALRIRDRLIFAAENAQTEQDGGNQELKLRPLSRIYGYLHQIGTIESEFRDPITETDVSDPPKGPKKYAVTYGMEKYKKNAMIIFNHKDFLGGNNTRDGTMQDEEALKTTFEMFGFQVESHLNLRKRDLLQKLKTFCSKDFLEYGCICVAVLTHGSKHGYLKAYDTRYSEHEVIECFDARKNPTLLGKPIIILIQACRGDEPATACNPGSPKLEEDVEMDNDDHYELPTESDMVIFHSSYVGRAAVRQVLKGSWFIQILCEKIQILAAFEDFESICREVRQEIALNKEHKMVLNNKPVVAKQMPVLTSTLLRLLYLRKYKGNDVEDKDSRKEKFVYEEKGNKATKCTGKGAQEKQDFYNELIFCQETQDFYNTTICGCDVYFEYLKKCLRLFIRENPHDEVAMSILQIAGNVQVEKGNKYVQVEMVNLIRKYLSHNADRFKFGEVVYLDHSRCWHVTVNDARDEQVTCCCVS